MTTLQYMYLINGKWVHVTSIHQRNDDDEKIHITTPAGTETLGWFHIKEVYQSTYYVISESFIAASAKGSPILEYVIFDDKDLLTRTYAWKAEHESPTMYYDEG